MVIIGGVWDNQIIAHSVESGRNPIILVETCLWLPSKNIFDAENILKVKHELRTWIYFQTEGKNGICLILTAV